MGGSADGRGGEARSVLTTNTAAGRGGRSRGEQDKEERRATGGSAKQAGVQAALGAEAGSGSGWQKQAEMDARGARWCGLVVAGGEMGRSTGGGEGPGVWKKVEGEKSGCFN